MQLTLGQFLALAIWGIYLAYIGYEAFRPVKKGTNL
ncbi:membrane protein [Mycobacterium phage Reindeer]|uniref:Membrane protein n=1 Tax=Mycobacterium phage Reindeer TaxID=2762283 RepID=A0A7G8LI57_9CAUD|nr:membrane protein [Mycobacterium phage Reindeer]QNJ56929.1 membrane protein [Mycobacterium phage Reindeer]